MHRCDSRRLIQRSPTAHRETSHLFPPVLAFFSLSLSSCSFLFLNIDPSSYYTMNFPFFRQRKESVFQLVPGAVEETISLALYTKRVQSIFSQKGRARRKDFPKVLSRRCTNLRFEKATTKRSAWGSPLPLLLLLLLLFLFLIESFVHSAEPAAAVFLPSSYERPCSTPVCGVAPPPHSHHPSPSVRVSVSLPFFPRSVCLSLSLSLPARALFFWTMTLRDSCNVRRLSILAGARRAAAVGREQGLYLRLGALTSLITLLSSSSSFLVHVYEHILSHPPPRHPHPYQRKLRALRKSRPPPRLPPDMNETCSGLFCAISVTIHHDVWMVQVVSRLQRPRPIYYQD